MAEWTTEREDVAAGWVDAVMGRLAVIVSAEVSVAVRV